MNVELPINVEKVGVRDGVVGWGGGVTNVDWGQLSMGSLGS